MSVDVAFTFVTLISSGFTLLIALTLFIILVLHLRHNQQVVLLLLANTYATIFVFSLVVFTATINVLQADLWSFTYLNARELVGCQFRGFLIYETFGCCYMSFVLQAFYRLAFSFNIICVFIQWIVYFCFLLPSYFWPNQLYSFYESAFYCGIQYEKIAGLSYTIMNIYVLPVIYLVIIYARIVYFMRHQIPQLIQTRQRRRAQRDFVVIRRILFTVIVLTLPGLPNIGFVIMTNISLSLSGAYYMYRIQWMIPSVAIFLLSIALVIMTPKVKELFTQRTVNQQRRIGPTNQRVTLQSQAETRF